MADGQERVHGQASRALPLTLAAGVLASYALLCALGDQRPIGSPGIQGASGPRVDHRAAAATVTPALEPAPACAEDEEHAHTGGHVCGLDAKAMLARFQSAVEEKRAIHPTVPCKVGGVETLAVARQVNLGLEPPAFQADSLEALLARHGLQLVRALPGSGLAVCETGAEVIDPTPLLAALAAEPWVRYAEPNFTARVALTPQDPFFSLAEGSKQARIEAAWDLTTGQPSIVVAVLDTGADVNHPDLRGQLLPGWDFVNQGPDVRDDNGHGTAMCGIIAAAQDGQGSVGVAFGARVLPVKVADAMGLASVADVAAGIDYALAQGARVVNLSMGARVGSQTLKAAIDRALQAGVLVVASAGNDPVHTEMFPAAYPGVLSVTTMSKDPVPAPGWEAPLAEGIEVGAPGEEVLTTLPGGVYGFVSGSSAAAAWTSGVAALCASRNQALAGAALGRVLRTSQTPAPALVGLESIYRFGRLDARTAVERAAPNYPDVAVSGLRVVPRVPAPGAPATLVVELENQGQVPLQAGILRLERVLAAGQRLELAAGQVTGLIPGERRELRFGFGAPPAGTHRIEATLSAAPGETETADNVRVYQLEVDAAAPPDLAVVSRTLSTPDVAQGTVTLTVEVENRGSAPVHLGSVQAELVEVRSAALAAASGVALPAPVSLGRALLPDLPPGQKAPASFTWTIPGSVPTGLLEIKASVTPQPGERVTEDNQVITHFMLGGAGPLQGLYQQSNGVDVILDSCWRIEPGRPYVPLQVFVPSKGGRTAGTRLRFTRAEVLLRDQPTGPATPLYQDVRGAAPSLAPAGLEIVDELGQPRGGPNALDLFADAELDANGRHEILRFPVAGMGLPGTLGAPVTRYLDSKVWWEQSRPLFFFWTTSRSGSHRSVLRVRFADAPLPALPGENHYHDVHHHTIAEWFFGSPLDVFAPRKAYGGPMQMVFESGYAMGFLPAPTPQAAWGKIISTDHNCFNNRTIPDPDGPDHRPPFGHTAASQHPAGQGQLEAYRTLLGPSAGEEVTWKQDVPLPRIHPVVNQILNLLPGLPLGAHMLTYHADHVEGPWHGGGWLRGPGSPNIDVPLFPLLNDLAKNRQGSQERAFGYCAHPFSGQGWRDNNLDRAFGLDPQYRDEDGLHDSTREFVLKGLEWFNGRGTRSLPTNQVDFEDLNPWADPVFAQGVHDWDAGVWDGYTLWHQILARTLEYSFQSDPETRFIRKIYQSGGSDAHGDFNFNTSRAATPITLQATFNVGDEAWYGVRTYCFGENKPGATPEDRWMAAYADGNTVVTDGPLVVFSLDADGRFDSGDLRWHDTQSGAEDEDGQIGGDGPLDGGRTALVRRGSPAPVFRYRYSSAPEWGPIASVLLYKTEVGNPNPTRRNGSVDQIIGVNELALTGPDAWLEQPLDPSREGPVTTITAFAMGAFTGGNPDQIDLGPDNYRCYTNPVYCVPYDAEATVSAVDTSNGTIPAGSLEVRFTFDVSMDPGSYAVEVKALDAGGRSTGRVDPALTTLVPLTGSGWSDRPGIKSSVLTLTNQDPIPLSGAAYPAAGRTSFVVYWADAPRDAAGNALNPIAFTFDEQQVGGSSGTGTTAPGATPGTTPGGTFGGGGGSGGGCALGTADAPAGGWSWLGALLVAGLLLRRRSTAHAR